MSKLFAIIFCVLVFYPVEAQCAVAPYISIFPGNVVQGEPVKVSVQYVSDFDEIDGVYFEKKAAGVFLLHGKPSAFLGIDLNQKPGKYQISVHLKNGVWLEKIFEVNERKKFEAPLGIPEKLGGNTSEAAERLVDTLSEENRSIYSVVTSNDVLWKGDFQLPISEPVVVTDNYGYVRQTVDRSITHKGTDFRALDGTYVKAMNRGIVRMVRDYRIYGKTIIIDHGYGLHTLYMHLSETNVREGELVSAGQIIGLSGHTGYAEKPHLHISVWIDKISIDPMKFVDLFKKD